MTHMTRKITGFTPVKVPLGTEPMGLWQSLRAMRRNVLSIIPDLAIRQPMVSGRTGRRWHMVMEPGALKRILFDNLDNYPKSLATKSLLKGAIGESLFIAEGAHWRWQRQTAAPAFSHRNVMALAPVMSAAAEQAVKRLHEAGPRAVEMSAEMTSATFDVISDVTFSGDAGFDRAAVHKAIDRYIDEVGRVTLMDLLGVPDWVPRPGRLFAANGVEEMKRVADRAVVSRAMSGPRALPDLLDLLRAGSDPETGRQMTSGELRDNLMAFIVAGHETTALALSWSLYLLAQDQDAQDRAREEARAVINGVATGEDVAKLPFIRQVLDEALRLYPSAALISRTARAPDMLCGREIRRNDTVILPIYALHRHRMLWDAPDEFRPERFEAGKPERYSYLPFGGGPRICIGASFALMEAVIILGSLLANFRFTPVKGRTPEPVMIITLRPEGGIWLEAEPIT